MGSKEVAALDPRLTSQTGNANSRSTFGQAIFLFFDNGFHFLLDRKSRLPYFLKTIFISGKGAADPGPLPPNP